MSTFVLVHGAWHGGWCWHKVVARLTRMGHTAVAPDMRGHGLDRALPAETTLDNLTESIATVVAAQTEPVVLVGHSFGGTIITQVGERLPEKIKRLVYLAAFVVPGGKTTLELSADDPESLLGPRIAFAPDGATATVEPAHLRACFYAQCSEDDVALARALLVPEGVAAFSSPSRASEARWGRIPSAYIECVQDRALGITRQRKFAGFLHSPERRSLDTDHSPFFSAPEALSAHLDALA